MHRAREEKTGRHVFRHHIGPDGPPHQFSGPLVCWKCTAPFVPVRKHKNKGADVQAQFRLAPKSEHDVECPLNPTLVSKHIAHGSHGLAEVDEQGILRLNLPENLTDLPPAAPDDDEVGEDVVRHSVTTVRPLLPPAVNSAAKIAMLLHIHDFETKIVDRFKVRPHNGRLIPWGKFCYGPTAASYTELYERCRRGEVFTHPVAVFGTVQRVNRDRQGRPYITLALSVPARNGAFHVAVRSEHATLIEPLVAGTHVLAVGAGWEVFDGGHTPQLRLWAGEHWQLAYWTTDGGGQPTTPHCPPPITALQRAHAQAEARSRRAARRPATPLTGTATVSAPAAQTGQPPQPDTHPSSAGVNGVESVAPEPPRQREPVAGTPDPAGAGVNTASAAADDAAVPDRAHPERPAPPTPDIPPVPAQPPAPADETVPSPTQAWQPPPLPPFPPPDPGEGGRRSALRRWLRRARRS
ncbi:hypothetical protein [Streptomyces mirabilis]|uniref:hypothetical protein n=1 Tax=Streptomyces mirabilis TaxID=68239 RepID=UPI0036A75D81